MREFHVAMNGNDANDGMAKSPFRSVSRAAKAALAGDRIVVHEGEYREWVKPAHGGHNSVSRITYEAAPGEKVVIKGSERIRSWVLEEGTVWKCVIPDTFFGDYNPYREVLRGDWLMEPLDDSLHTGEVYLNGKAFYEAGSLDEVKNPQIRTEGVLTYCTERAGRLLHPEDSVYRWFVQPGEGSVTIYANFHGSDPNEEVTEINVRKCCFYPEQTGMDYITVRGFEMAHAACPWAPPTADQPGLLGTHWSKGWIIEDNVIHDAKCCGISIGRDASIGNNLSSRTHRKSGTQYHIEGIFRAVRSGWSRETIGSHIIRNNTICDCGQNAIVGHLGCAFSQIIHNHIYNIAVKREFFGCEIAGIKLHSAIDVQICHNSIHNCAMGTWLDWEAQGTRVSGNLYYENDLDVMMEVNNGPYMLDNNIFASPFNLDNVSQGGAYLHNLFCGRIRRLSVPDRSTPYHFPHTTQIAGTTVIHGGDDRVCQNIFLGGEEKEPALWKYGTADYDGHTVSLEEYVEKVAALGNGDLEKFRQVGQPVFIKGNAYLKGAEGFDREESAFAGKTDPQVRIAAGEDGTVWLELSVEEGMRKMDTRIYTTQDLGTPRIAEAPYENPDGTPIVFDRDYLGRVRGKKPLPGPFAELAMGRNRIRVW